MSIYISQLLSIVIKLSNIFLQSKQTTYQNKKRIGQFKIKNLCVNFYFDIIYLSIDAAAVLPAPIARITVAAPVTASPPA